MASKAVVVLLLAAAVVASAFEFGSAEAIKLRKLGLGSAEAKKLGKLGKLGLGSAEAKLGKLGKLGLGSAEAKLGKLGNLEKLGRLVITGVVPCNTGSLIDIATSPLFPNADVELRCMGKLVAGATTNTNGSFTIEADMTGALAAFIGGCRLVVDTPLIKCNADLADVGTLVSYLPLTRVLGGIFHLFPAGFSFHARRS